MAMAGLQTASLFTSRVPATNIRMVEGRCASSSYETACLPPAQTSWSDIAPQLSTLVRWGPHPYSPFDSLVSGHWVKLICGASFQDVADIRNLSLVYTLAGVDCIDCAAEQSVVTAVREGIEAAAKISLTLTKHMEMELQKPWIMVSINDDEDVHFRKAEFDSRRCPASCPRPCERVCPASAIKLYTSLDENGGGQSGYLGGVLNDRCYGCGRCISVCPLGLIGANSYMRNLDSVTELFESGTVDAVEIHTNARHLEAFTELWQSLHCSMSCLKLIAVSLPDLHVDMLSTMWNLYNVMRPELHALNLWQMDGRPMSGDIGKGATKAAVALAAKVATSSNRPPGFLQLAGGTNAHTVKAMKLSGLNQSTRVLKSTRTGTEQKTCEELLSEKIELASIAGIAYGGYARKIVSQVLAKMDPHESPRLEEHPLLLWKALKQASDLVSLSKNSP